MIKSMGMAHNYTAAKSLKQLLNTHTPPPPNLQFFFLPWFFFQDVLCAYYNGNRNKKVLYLFSSFIVARCLGFQSFFFTLVFGGNTMFHRYLGHHFFTSKVPFCSSLLSIWK